VSNYDPQLALRQTIAGVLDHPSVYMGGPSRQHLRKADQIIECLRRDPRLMEALRAGMETPAGYDPHDHTHAAYMRAQETCPQCSGSRRTSDGLNCTACNAMGESAAETLVAKPRCVCGRAYEYHYPLPSNGACNGYRPSSNRGESL
jgi:hypothetical protein